MRILAIDPGTTVSGVCLYETSTTGRGSVRLAIGKAPNGDVLRWLRADHPVDGAVPRGRPRWPLPLLLAADWR